MNSPRILIADDHSIIRVGMKFILESQFTDYNLEEVENCKELSERLKDNTFTHLILDLQLQDCNVMNIFSGIREQYPGLQILIYTMSPEEIFGKRLLHMGANGFLSKQSSQGEIIKALHLFLLNRKFVSDKLQQQLRSESGEGKSGEHPFEDLSEREMAVFNNLMNGKGVKEIAGLLNLKATTVATYKARIFDKVGVNNMVELQNIAQFYHFNG
ncbi:MAG: response regulator transcription factor [Chitinophagaceae bacterium]|nr:response regulator transcription factor [Chitinophagaceae bacterium]